MGTIHVSRRVKSPDAANLKRCRRCRAPVPQRAFECTVCGTAYPTAALGLAPVAWLVIALAGLALVMFVIRLISH